MNRAQEKFMRMFRFGNDLSLLSTCKGLQCGAVAFPTDFSTVHAIGFNGPPMGQPNDSCTAPSLQEGELARCGCIHAEANLVAKIGHLSQRCIVYSTTAPCPHCAGLIVNCRQVGAVVYAKPYWTERGLDILNAAGVSICPVENVVRDGSGYIEFVQRSIG